MDLEEDVKSFTARDIKQYQELTITVRDHWLKMLENDKMPDDLRLAVQMSIKQAEKDLEFLAKAFEDRKGKIGEAAFQAELSAPVNADSGEVVGDSDSE